ncbi:helix-turn-helix transcriptional regulator [Catenuloplanes atrovinosus]|uniref:AraC-like DNA-binding protein n=1 Tax=Catenuloplanes atrovinosus TaxID=137266 RepID=A0AAE4CCH7_9ACTN|nr:helix-turn-helix transcriptional regulator [Catenuloplanes atrovinosus]MDR7279267.1 AraC-like DNA-binding protein [Catenuloplanes atrovinosus]
MVTVFETTDADEAYEALRRAYGKLGMRAGDGDHYVRLGHHSLGPARLHRNTFGMTVDMEGTPQGAVVLGRIGEGRIALDTPGSARRFGMPGEAFVVLQPGEPHQARLERVDIELALLDQDLIAEVSDAGDRPVRFLHHERVPAQGAALWGATYDYVSGCVTGTPEALAEPLVAGSMARLLAATALSVFPNDGTAEPTIEDRRDAHPASLHRAIAFIDDNAHRDITPAEIAAAAHVSVRAVQLAFRRHLGTTPREYLRRVRLAHAHRELLTADPRDTTVMTVAGRWGFADHSRFTAHYRAEYGVIPSQTLRRAG